MLTLRAGGRRFDAEAFAAKSTLPRLEIYAAGAGLRPRVSRRKWRGFVATVADLPATDLPALERKALRFLDKHKAELRRLRKFAGVESVFLDFLVEIPRAVLSGGLADRHIGSELAGAAGKLGIGLNLSIYAGDTPPRSKRA